MMSAIKNVKKANKIISANICAASMFALDFMGNIYMKEFKSSAMFSFGGIAVLFLYLRKSLSRIIGDNGMCTNTLRGNVT